MDSASSRPAADRAPARAPIFLVDAFAHGPFTGNPAAVCLLDAAAPEAWMQALAAELKQSETAFVVPRAGQDGFDLRWFTPECEVELCGHATLASAHVLWQTLRLRPTQGARFSTRSGWLTCSLNNDGAIEMDFPSRPPEPRPAPPEFASALRIEARDARWIGRAGLNWFVELGGGAAVRQMSPDFALLLSADIPRVVATARAEPGSGADFVSRFFAPGAGIDEDPVTGSAHCSLAPYWCERLKRNPLVGYQASARGGYVEVEVRGERVLLRGRARSVLQGTLAAQDP